MLSGENALLELEVDAILTEHFREELTLHLLHELVDGVAKNEVTLVGRVSM